MATGEERVLGELRHRLRRAATIWKDLHNHPGKKKKGKPGKFIDAMTNEDAERILQWKPGNRLDTTTFNEWIMQRFSNEITQRFASVESGKETKEHNRLDVDVEGNLVEGNFVEGNFVEGNFVEGNFVEGNLVEGNFVERNFVEPIDDPYAEVEMDDYCEKSPNSTSTSNGDDLLGVSSLLTAAKLLESKGSSSSLKVSSDSSSKQESNDTYKQEEPPLKKRRLITTHVPSQQAQHSKTKIPLHMKFPAYGFTTMMYNESGTRRERGVLWFYYEQLSQQQQPTITEKAGLVFGELWIRSVDFLRFIGPRRNIPKFCERLTRVQQWSVQKNGMVKSFTYHDGTTTEKDWFVSVGHLIVMYKNHTPVADGISYKLSKMRRHIQAHLDDKHIILVTI